MSGGKKKPKVSSLQAKDLIAEARADCSGLRRLQVLTAIGTLAFRGDQAAINYLKKQKLQSALHP